jgi:hypothetical protein
MEGGLRVLAAQPRHAVVIQTVNASCHTSSVLLHARRVTIGIATTAGVGRSRPLGERTPKGQPWNGLTEAVDGGRPAFPALAPFL